MKDLINLVELIIIARFAWKAARFILRGKKKYKKSLIGKVWLLVSRQLHSSIDNRLREQKERLAGQQVTSEKVVQFRKRNIN